MTKQEMRNIKESLGVEMFKMNYKAGIRLPNLEAFFAGDDSALDAKALERLEKMLAAEVIMVEPKMDIKKEEMDLILNGLSADGSISEEAKKALLARIEEGKAKEYPMGEVKRQLRWRTDAEQGKKIADAIDKLW